MKPKNRALPVIIVAFVVAVAAGGAYLLLGAHAPPTSLPIPAGVVLALDHGPGYFAPIAYGKVFPFVVNSSKFYRVTGGWRATAPTDVNLLLSCTGYCGGPGLLPPPDAPTRGTFGMTIAFNISNPAQNFTMMLRFLSSTPDSVTITQAFVLTEVPAGTVSCPPAYETC